MRRLTLILGVVGSLFFAACADRAETVVDLFDYGLHQRYNVTTDGVWPADRESQRLAEFGLRLIEREGLRPTFGLTGDKVRLRFFSADGATRGATLEASMAQGARGRKVVYALNGEVESHFTMLPGNRKYQLTFREESVKQGWNSLDLKVRKRGAKGRTPVRISGVRFWNELREEPKLGRPGTRGQRIERRDEELRMPAGSLFDVVFEVPRKGRFRGRLAADGPSRTGALPRADHLSVELLLMDATGAESSILQTDLEIGDSTRVDVPLGDWHGQQVRLRLLTDGPRPTTAVWTEARITGIDAEQSDPLEGLIPPLTAGSDGRIGRPDVLVILMDAARADAFSPWGGPYETPALESLVSLGTKFERALSPSSWTGQTMPGIFTGFYPDTVGVHRWGNKLTDAVPTLASLFASSGYHTSLWSHHPIYSRAPSFSRGFDDNVYSEVEGRQDVPGIDELFSGDRPSFAFVHLLPPHAPYTPPPPFLYRYSGWYRGKVPASFKILNKFPNKRDPATLNADDRKYIRDRYQDNVAFADHLVGRLLDDLRAKGRFDDTMIVVTSDHGEAFLEHDHFLHSGRLYWEFLHVPFAIKWPASVTGFREIVEETVSLVDLAPTLVSGLDLDGGDRGFQGRDLIPRLFDGGLSERPIYAVTRSDPNGQRPPRTRLRWERDGWALLWNRLHGTHELYHLADDPMEQNDLAGERPTLALSLLQELQMQYAFNQTLLGLTADDAQELDPKLAAELKALGYL